MNLMKKTIVVFAGLLIMQNNASAQDEHLSQFYQNEAFVNPGFTGNGSSWRLSSNSRKQWSSVTTPFSTSVFFVDGNFVSTRKMSFAGGLGFVADKAGSSNLKTRQVLLNFSSKVKVNRTQDLAAGLQVGYMQRTLGLDDFKWDSQYNGKNYDPTLGNRESVNPSTLVNFGVAGGLAYFIKINNFKKVKLGVSAFHLNTNRNSFYNSDGETQYARYSFFMNGEFGKPKTNMAYLPSLLVQKQGPSLMFVPGILMTYRLGYDSRATNYSSSSAIIWGFHYRLNDAIIPSLHFEYHRKLRVGLSYDINVSRLTPASNSLGGFELSLNYFIYKK